MGWGIWLLIIIDNHQKRWKDFVVDFCDQHWDKWRHLRYNSYRQSLVAQKPVGKKSDEKGSILTQDGNLQFVVKFFLQKIFFINSMYICTSSTSALEPPTYWCASDINLESNPKNWSRKRPKLISSSPKIFQLWGQGDRNCQYHGFFPHKIQCHQIPHPPQLRLSATTKTFW